MCGGISAGFSLLRKEQILKSQLAFNAGRITSYAAAGAAAGALGSAGAYMAAVLPAQIVLLLRRPAPSCCWRACISAGALPLLGAGTPRHAAVAPPAAARRAPGAPRLVRRRAGVGLAALRPGLRRAARRGIRGRCGARRHRHGRVRRRHAALAARGRGCLPPGFAARCSCGAQADCCSSASAPGASPTASSKPFSVSRRRQHERRHHHPEERAPLDLGRAAGPEGARAHGAGRAGAARVPGAARHGALYRRIPREAAPPEGGPVSVRAPRGARARHAAAGRRAAGRARGGRAPDPRARARAAVPGGGLARRRARVPGRGRPATPSSTGSTCARRSR